LRSGTISTISTRPAHQFQPGNPGGPGRPPSRIPDFFRRLTECEDEQERERLLESGKRNPLIAAKLRAIASDNEALSNLASEQVLDRVFGKAKQSIEHSGQIELEAVLFVDTKDALS